jgi:hypothetical protein
MQLIHYEMVPTALFRDFGVEIHGATCKIPRRAMEIDPGKRKIFPTASI